MVGVVAVGVVAPAGGCARGFGGGLRFAVTRMVGRTTLPDRAAGASGTVAVGCSPGTAGCGAGVVSAGAGPFGGGVCAKAPTQADVIKIDVDASNRARTGMLTPFRGRRNSTIPALSRGRFARARQCTPTITVLPQPLAAGAPISPAGCRNRGTQDMIMSRELHTDKSSLFARHKRGRYILSSDLTNGPKMFRRNLGPK